MDQKCSYYDIKMAYRNKKYGEFLSMANYYINNVDKNTNIIFMRAKVYRKLEMIDEAIQDLNYILSCEKNNKYALIELYFVLYQNKRYEEAYKLIEDIYNTRCMKAHSTYITELVIRKNLGMSLKRSNLYEDNYTTRQLFNYDEDLAIKHISNHNIDDPTDEKTSQFNKNVDIVELIKAVKDNLKTSKRCLDNEVLDKYYFSISNIGFNGDNVCNTIKVIVEPNTTNIFALYPVLDNENDLSILDCDYSKIFKEEKQEKVKTLSQIDKFNKRFEGIN